MLLANVTLSVLEDQSVAFEIKPFILVHLELVKGDSFSIHAQVDLGMLVPKDVTDELLDRAELNRLVNALDAIEDALQRHMLDNFFDKCDHLDNQVPATVSLSMQFIVLSQAKHHLDDLKPDLFLFVF